ncbi:MAG: DUF4397 domain-containing protein [Wenzhouxiangellaceae bacterium]|nr:MAG: DUF4397 domain-containing protein [Wenzhouxiangellaceae bacterium]
MSGTAFFDLRRLAACMIVAFYCSAVATAAPVTESFGSAPAGISGDEAGSSEQVHDFWAGGGALARVDAPTLFILQLPEQPLARYAGEISGLAAPGRTSSGRLDVRSPDSQRYVNFLVERQQALIADASSLFGRRIEPMFSYQHAFNGVAVELSAEEAVELLRLGLIVHAEPYAEYPLLTDAGPAWIGSPAVWDGSATGGSGTLGEGVVVGIIDSGININHPSFAAVAEDGFVHVNPLGSGNFIGWCNPGVGEVTDTCNDKLIGTWEFLGGLGLDGLYIPGGEDENGHGTHVAATAAGNPVTAQFRDQELELTGVAPRANIIAYDACYTNPQGQGLCPNVSTLAAINQVVADGVVDVINYSIGGGTEPWQQAISLAFLAAVDAGVFVSAAAGNSGPSPNTSFHVQPWVASVAASTHNRSFEFGAATVSVIEPEDPPAAAVDIAAVQGTGPWITEFAGPAGHDPDNVLGCDPFDAGTFSGQIALIARGTCNFVTKVNNAAAAGAVGVVVYQNVAEPPISMGGLAATSIPAFMITQAGGQAIVELIADEPGEVVIELNQPPTQVTIDDALGDVVVGFSSRGPNPFDVTKPSFAAPGSAILAAVEVGGGPVGAEYGLKSGTSMASPHNAGAAALLRALHPTWLPSEIQSALMLTAFDGMQAVAPGGAIVDATVFDQGAGRINVDRAAASPLVLRETTLNFFLADPAAGGDPRTLNLAGLSDGDCLFECSFQRTVRSVATEAKTFQVTLETDSDLDAVITPSEFTILPGQNQVLNITIDAGLGNDSWKFGRVVLTPLVELPDELFRDRFEGGNGEGRSLPVAPDPSSALSMPVSVFATEPFPVIDVDDTALEGSALVGETTSLTLDLGNIGDADLEWSIFEGLARGETLFEQTDTTGNAIVSGFFTQTPPNTGAYSAEAFTLAAETAIGGLFFEGFSTNGAPIANLASDLRFYIYADDNGVPAGHPEDGEDNELLSVTLPLDSAGVELIGSNIDLDLRLAGVDLPVLPAGTYWVSAAPAVASSGNRWNWFNATTGPQVETAKIITPGAAFNNGFPDWTDLTAVGAAFAHLSFAVDGAAECGADWLSVTPPSGIIAPADSLTLALELDATGLSGGTLTTNLCIDSNDPAQPVVVIPVTFEVVDDSALLQVAHLAPFAADLADTAVDVAINGDVVLAGVEYGASTGALPLLPGIYDIQILLADTSTVVLEALGVQLDEGVKYTAIASGDNDNQALALDLLVDDLNPPAAGNFKLRLGHLAPFADGTASAEVRLANGTLIEAVDYRDFTGFIELPEGAYDLIITAPGGEPTLIDPIELAFSSGDIISAFAVGDGVNQDLGIFALPPDAPGFFVDLREPTARVQVAHLAPFADDLAATEVDIAVNGTVALSGVPYGASTAYLELPAGPTDLEILEPGTGVVLISASVTLLDRTDYSVIAIGNGAQQDLALLALVDDNSEPAAGEFRLRLGHLAPFAPDEASAEVRLANGTLIAAVDFGDVADFDLAAGSYDLTITAPGGTPVLINPIPLSFSGGEIVSAFATGDGINQDLGVFAWPSDAVGDFLPLLVEGVASIQEDFEGSFPPDGWERVSTGVPATCLWDLTSEVVPNFGPVDPDTGGRPNYAGGDGAAATLDSDACGSSTNIDAVLITPPVNLAGLVNPRLEFVLSFNTAFDNNQFFVDISTDLGANWTNLASWDNQDVSPTGPGTPISIALDDHAGSIAALVRFRNVAGWSNWVQIDQVSIDSASESVEANLVGFASFYEPGDSDQGTETVSFIYTEVDQSIEQIFNVFSIEQDGVEIDAATYAALFDSLDYDDYIRGLSGTTVDNVVAPETRDVAIEFTLSETAPSGAYTLVINSYDVTGVDPADVSLADAKAGVYPVLSTDSQIIGIGTAITENLVIDLAGQESPSLACGTTPADQRPGFAVIMAPGTTVETVDFDILLETNGGSWASEALIGFGTTSQRLLVSFRPGFGVDEPTPPGGQAFSGGFDLVPAGATFDLDPDGALWVTFCEVFNDNADPDAFYLDPSSITINDTGAGDRSLRRQQGIGPETRAVFQSTRGLP